MPSRHFMIAAVVLVTLAVGTPLLAGEYYLGPRSPLQLAQSREPVAHPRQGAKLSRKEETVSNRLDSLTELLGSNKELIVYGAIASFGILMMGLAIGNVSSNSRNNAAAQLTLLKQEKEKAENLAKLKSEFLNQV